MKKTKKALIINPYLETMGGAEGYVLSIAHILEKEGYAIYLASDSADVYSQISSRFSISFKNKQLYRHFYTQSAFERIARLGGFDVVLYNTDGSYFFSLARKNIILAMYPQKNLYKKTFLNALKWKNCTFLTFSQFSNAYITRWTRQKSAVIYPYIEDAFLKAFVPASKKEEIILSVGRFFGHLHSKNHLALIRFFQKLQKKNPRFRSFTLVLVGGLVEEDSAYFDRVKKAAKKDKNIILCPNLSRGELLSYYKKAMFYWHAAGYGVDVRRHPEKVEHLGITPLEAMAAGCVVFAYNAGGQREIIKQGQNGFLYSDEKTLFSLMNTACDSATCNEIGKTGHEFIKRTFSYGVFTQRVREVFL